MRERDWSLTVRLAMVAAFVALGATWIGLERHVKGTLEPCWASNDGSIGGGCEPIAGLFVAAGVAGFVALALLALAYARRAR